MSKKVHVFLWIPLLMLMLHSVTPHHHKSARENFSFAQHECPSNLLSDVFSFDMGTHHLEEFEISDFQPDFNADWLCFFAIVLEFEFVEIHFEEPVYYEASLPVNQQYLAASHSLRAPPAFIV